MDKVRKKPICKSCCTPMKGHKKGVCRPSPWCDHGDNNKEHGGRYEWETQRWNGSEWKPWKPEDVVPIMKNEVIVPAEEPEELPSPELEPIPQAKEKKKNWEESLDEFISTGTVIHMNHHLADNPPPPKEPEEPEEPEEPKEPKDEWKPLADGYWWNYYRNWQQNSAFVPFPTQMGMTSAQLGDIMENYAKYRRYYR